MRANSRLRIGAFLLSILCAFLILARSRLLSEGSQSHQAGIVRVVLHVKPETYQGRWTPHVLETVARVLEKRARKAGISTVRVTVRGADRLVVALPPAAANKTFLAYLTSPARLLFYPLPQLGNRDGSSIPVWNLSKDPQTQQEVLIHADTGKMVTRQELQSQVFRHPAPLSNQAMLPQCRVERLPGMNTPGIAFAFDTEGSRLFAQLTRASVGKHLGIFLDGRLLTAPVINSPITGGGILEGNFTPTSAKALVDQINAGFLPVSVELVGN